MGLEKGLVLEQSHPVPLSVPFALWYISGIGWESICAASMFWALELYILAATWFAWELLWCDLKEQNQKTTTFLVLLWNLFRAFLYHLFFSPLCTGTMKSAHIATHMNIFLCAGKLELFDSNHWFDQSRAFSPLWCWGSVKAFLQKLTVFLLEFFI